MLRMLICHYVGNKYKKKYGFVLLTIYWISRGSKDLTIIQYASFLQV